MGRPNGSRPGPPGSDQWPGWVLGFAGGYYPDDPVMQAARTRAFHQWREDRRAWFAERGIPVSVRVCNEEHRRRAHSERRGQRK